MRLPETILLPWMTGVFEVVADRIMSAAKSLEGSSSASTFSPSSADISLAKSAAASIFTSVTVTTSNLKRVARALSEDLLCVPAPIRETLLAPLFARCFAPTAAEAPVRSAVM